MPDVIIEEILEDDMEGKYLNTSCFQCSLLRVILFLGLELCVFGSCKFFNGVCFNSFGVFSFCSPV